MQYLTADENYWACDIEADDLLDKATTIHCCCVENILSGEKHAFTTASEFLAWLKPEYILVGHNFIAYDLVMLNRFWRASVGVSRVVDTFVLSQLYNPVLTGGHSLGAWGIRLKFLKGDYNDFSHLTPEMIEYCQNDVSLTARVFTRLTDRMKAVGFSEEGCEIESLAWNIIQNKQRRVGFPFDERKAHGLYANIRQREASLKEEIYRRFPPRLLVVGEYAKAFKADGQPTALYQRHSEQYPRLELREDGGYLAYDYVPFNLGSPQQRIAKLLELGWTPTRKTPKGNPQVDEEELLEFSESSGIPEVAMIAKWLVANSRANMIRTWLDAVDEKTHAIHGKLFLASTLRYRHNSPNSANIPAVRQDKETKEVLYGEAGTWAYECRDLYTCGDPDKYSLVGVDAKGIQIRILLNYAYSKEAFELYTTGDPHENNATLLGLAHKPAAKKAFYTLIMGGQGKRIAADQAQFGTRLTPKDGDNIRARMIATIPGFQELIDRLQNELLKTGRIRLCDGTPILVPSPHMVIPYLLQGDESRIMKLAMIKLDKEIRRHGLDARKVADIHDEWQFVVADRDITRFKELALGVFPPTGESFDYRVPIEGDAKVGKTWAETH